MKTSLAAIIPIFTRICVFHFSLQAFATAEELGPDSNLAVIDIRTKTEIRSDEKVPCTIKMVALPNIKEGNSDLLKGQIRIRGASSQAYEKKSFAFKLDEPTRWLGLGKERDWILNAAFVDCSMMRHKLSYDLFKSLSVEGAQRLASSSRFVEIKLNGQYHGVYLLMERVERSLLGFQRFDKSATHHAVIYKAIDHGANFQQLGHGAYEQHEPEPELCEYWMPLDDLNQFVSNAPGTQFFDAKSGIGTRFDVDYAIDYHLFLLLTSNMDGNDKNFILARDAPTEAIPQPRFFFVPWDYDATFGRNWDGSIVEPNQWLSNHLFDRLLENVTYKKKYISRWRELRKQQFSVQNISRMIDENSRTLGAAAARNERRWKGILAPDSGQLTFAEDLKQMKAWIASRTKWLDEELARRTNQ